MMMMMGPGSKKEIPKDYMLVPPDGGWGWVVLGGIILSGQIIVVPTLCFGIFLKDILISMDTTTATASWIPSINMSMCMFFAPVCGMICQTYSCRTSAILGGLIASSGVFLSYFATRVEVLFLTYGVLVGIGNGLCLNANFLILSQYFRKYYGIVTGIALGSYAAGRLIMTPVMQLATETYGIKGTFLIMSALQLHICVGASLFQPASKHQKLVPIDNNENNGKENNQTDSKPNAENRFPNMEKNIIGNGEEKSQLLIRENNKKNEWVDEKQQLSNNRKTPAEMEPRRICQHRKYDKSLLHLSSPLDVFGSMETIRSRAMSTSEDAPAPPSEDTSNCCLRWCRSGPLASLDFTILKEPIFYVVCIGGITNYITSIYSNIFLPPLGLENDLSPMEAASVLSIRAGSEIVGRIGSPLMQQRFNLPLRHFYILVTCLTISTLIAIGMMTTFASMSSMSILSGVTFGAQTGLSLVMMIHYMGADRLLSVLGLSQFIQGFATLLIGPILGWTKDQFGNFKCAFYFLAGMQTILALSWLLKPLLQRKPKSQEDNVACSA